MYKPSATANLVGGMSFFKVGTYINMQNMQFIYREVEVFSRKNLNINRS